MRTQKQIEERIEKYEHSLQKIQDKDGRKNLRYMIAELLWCLGEEGK